KKMKIKISLFSLLLLSLLLATSFIQPTMAGSALRFHENLGIALEGARIGAERPEWRTGTRGAPGASPNVLEQSYRPLDMYGLRVLLKCSLEVWELLNKGLL
ncbi:hypothetical protein RJ639_033452, partial [Escallonia herrerae]